MRTCHDEARPRSGQPGRQARRSRIADWAGCTGRAAVVWSAMSALLIASPAEAQPVCFSNPDCPAASVCNWGLCESAIGMFSTVVVQVSVADVADVSGVAGTEGMRAYLADELARALNETGVVHALRERGNAFSLREVLARAGAKGSAYVVFATMVAFDGVRASVKVETWGVETEAREEGLSARLEVSAGRVVHECDRLANRAALHFSGRPGILGTRIAVVRKQIGRAHV